jgi:hypothetical protein
MQHVPIKSSTVTATILNELAENVARIRRFERKKVLGSLLASQSATRCTIRGLLVALPQAC